jgi:WhiB family transcriptional regulator, redox-sensing transcriptional regulator
VTGGQALGLIPAAAPCDARWWDFAACKGTDTDAFYPEHGNGTRYLRKICARCPVQPQCLEDALAQPVSRDHGFWGGTSENERKALRKACDLGEAA